MVRGATGSSECDPTEGLGNVPDPPLPLPSSCQALVGLAQSEMGKSCLLFAPELLPFNFFPRKLPQTAILLRKDVTKSD